jgi:adenylosuccinate synthase
MFASPFRQLAARSVPVQVTRALSRQRRSPQPQQARASSDSPNCELAHVSRHASEADDASCSVVRTVPVRPLVLSRLHSSTPDVSGYHSQVCAILGAQWGDEGKGKLVDILAKKYDLIGRFNGGANAGHTLVVEGKKYAFHLLPCGMLYAGKRNIIGNGVVLDIPIMLSELKKLTDADIDVTGRLLISDRCQLLFDAHKIIDAQQETNLKENNIGTTKKGIGPCYSSKANRNGVRAGDLVDFENFQAKHRKLIESLQKSYGNFPYDIAAEQEKYRAYRDQIVHLITDTNYYVYSALKEGKTLLVEGANAAMLDIDMGTYPFVTSSATTAGGISTGLGLPPNKIGSIIGIVKAYTTRVGSGPFPTELLDSVGEQLRKTGGEFGTTTGRPRRCGWLDIPVLQYSHAINGYASMNITKLDVLSDLETIKIGVSYTLDGKPLPPGRMPAGLAEFSRVKVIYESMPGWKCDISKVKSYADLPAAAKKYLDRIEELSGIPISWVGTGPGREDMVTKGFQKQA